MNFGKNDLYLLYVEAMMPKQNKEKQNHAKKRYQNI